MEDGWARVVETFFLWISIRFPTRLVDAFLRHCELPVLGLEKMGRLSSGNKVEDEGQISCLLCMNFLEAGRSRNSAMAVAVSGKRDGGTGVLVPLFGKQLRCNLHVLITLSGNGIPGHWLLRTSSY